MLGLLFIVLIIIFSFLIAAAYNYIAKITRKNKVDAKVAPTQKNRIYYVKNSSSTRRKKNRKQPSVAIKCALIEKTDDNFLTVD